MFYKKTCIILLVFITFMFSNLALAMEVFDDGESNISNEQNMFVGDWFAGGPEGVHIEYIISNPKVAKVTCDAFTNESLVEFTAPGDTIVSCIYVDSWESNGVIYKRSNTLFHVKGETTSTTINTNSNTDNEYAEGSLKQINPEEILELVNRERRNVGASPLVLDDELVKAANIRAEELCQSFSYTRPNGTGSYTIINSTDMLFGENIASGQENCQDVIAAWMKSPSHRANILNPDFKRFGIACYQNDNTKYIFYWDQLFTD